MFGIEQDVHDDRYARGQEWLDILLPIWSEEASFDYDGHYYRLAGVDAQPKPVSGHLPILLGGKAGPRAAALAARFADEYNVIFVSPEECREVRERLDERLTLSLMTGLKGFRREQMEAYAEAGVERVMLQHLDHADLDAIERTMQRLRKS